jgi:hypothetical protein
MLCLSLFLSCYKVLILVAFVLTSCQHILLLLEFGVLAGTFAEEEWSGLEARSTYLRQAN